MKRYLTVITVMNFVFVLVMLFGPSWLYVPAVFTAVILFVYDIPKAGNKPLLLTGALFNFIGVVGGGINHVVPVMYMALMGSILLLFARFGSSITTAKKKR
jgi:hypothetical protein